MPVFIYSNNEPVRRLPIETHLLQNSKWSLRLPPDRVSLSHQSVAHNQSCHQAAKQLLRDISMLFQPPADKMCIRDRYNLKEAEQFRYFTEYYLKYITKYGKNPRLWGSLKHMKGNTPCLLYTSKKYLDKTLFLLTGFSYRRHISSNKYR